MIYPIIPAAKPRMTQRDRWKKRPVVLRYYAFKDECRLRGVKCAVGDSYKFTIPMPKSWSKKKRVEMDGEPHTLEKFDLDNLVKALWDAVLLHDGAMWRVGGLEKVWGYDGAIEIVPDADGA